MVKSFKEFVNEELEIVYEDTIDNLIYHANHPDPKKSKKGKKKLQAYLDGVKEKIRAAKGVHKW